MDRKSATSQCRAWSDDIVMNGKDKREVSDEHTDTDVPFPFGSMVGTAPIECLNHSPEACPCPYGQVQRGISRIFTVKP